MSSLPDQVSLQKSAKIPNGVRIAAANSLANTIDDSHYGDDADWCHLFKFAPIATKSSIQSSIEGSLSTNFKNKLQYFNDKTVHLTPSIHDHHMNVSKSVDLRKAINNKLLVGDVSAAVRLIASDDSIIEQSPETVEALCLKHPAAPANIRQVPIPDIPYERDVSDT